MPTEFEPASEEVRRSFIEEHVRPLMRTARRVGIPPTDLIVAIIDEASEPDAGTERVT